MRLLSVLACLAAGVACAGAQGDPGRQRVDIDARPWTAIGLVNNGSYGRCTGVLIGPRLVVTAAHCLFNRRTKRFVRPQSVHFVLGYDRGKFGFQSTASSFRTGAGYDPLRPTETIADDWALLELVEPAPASVEPLPAAAALPKAGDTLASAGFGRDRAYALTAIGTCRCVSVTGAGLIVTQCPIVSGYSGGPLIDAEGRLVGIQVAGATGLGRGLAVAVPSSAWAEGR